jgi:hypothetical protein
MKGGKVTAFPDSGGVASGIGEEMTGERTQEGENKNSEGHFARNLGRIFYAEGALRMA